MGNARPDHHRFVRGVTDRSGDPGVQDSLHSRGDLRPTQSTLHLPGSGVERQDSNPPEDYRWAGYGVES